MKGKVLLADPVDEKENLIYMVSFAVSVYTDSNVSLSIDH